MNRFKSTAPLVALTLSLLFILLTPPTNVLHILGFAALGGSLVSLFWPFFPQPSFGEKLALTLAFALAYTAVVGLILIYMPVSLSRWSFGVTYIGTAVILAWVSAIKEPEATPFPQLSSTTWMIGSLLLVLLVSRFYDLGYKEVQGDEAIVLTRAADVILGDTSQLFLHQKGPAELLFPIVLWTLEGAQSEFGLRLPFAFANVLAVGLLFLLMQRWGMKRETAVWGGLLLGVMGFGIAFGRIVQYQSLVYAWSFAAILAAETIYDRWDENQQNWFLSALPGLFLGCALWAHYDAVLFAPVVAWIMITRQPITHVRDIGQRLWPSLLSGGLIVSLFYIPYILHPNFQETFSYLLNDRVGVSNEAVESVANGSLAIVWQMITFYNSSAYIVGLSLLALIGACFAISDRQKWRGWVTWLLFAAVPLFFYLVIVADPRTHVYTFFPGVVVLAAFGCEKLMMAGQKHGRFLTYLMVGAGFAWVSYSAQYVGRLFLFTTAEHQRQTVQSPVLGDWKSWDTPPEFGLFGFPYRAGWQSLPDVVEPDLVYRSNEELPITNWYLPNQAQTNCGEFDLFLLAQDVQDEQAYDPALLESMYLTAEVDINGRSKLQLYSHTPSETVHIIDGTDQARWFTPQEISPDPYTGETSVGMPFGDAIWLHGYDLTPLNESNELQVVLYWSALKPLGRNYQSFVHLVTDELIAQSDKTPNCTQQPTSGWEMGQIVRDSHTLVLSQNSLDGVDLRIYIGLYDLITLERLPTADWPDNALIVPFNP